MLRVLIVSDTDGDFESRVLASQLAEPAPDAGFVARRIELPRAGATPAAVRRAGRAEAEFAPDVLHAVGPSSLLACAAVGSRPIVYSAPAEGAGRGWLGLASAFRDVTVVAPSQAAAAELAARKRVRPGRIAVIPPPLPRPTDSPSAGIDRAALGLSDEHRVLIAPGPSTRRTGHRYVIWVSVLLHYLDARYRLLLWGHGWRVGAVRQLAAAVDQPELCVFAEDVLGRAVDFAALPQFADLALFAAPHAVEMLPVAACQRAGVPVALPTMPGATTAEVAGATGDRAWVIGSRKPSDVAGEIHAWFEGRQPDLGPVVAAAREHAARTLDPSVVLRRWAEVYDAAVVGRRVAAA